ncbi:MAG: phosphoglycerate kinase [Candidatus Nomurabacteria bacterium]|nr:phosphoglycerate kinase [Candidatus Nomurabacteria bacterium]
MNIPRINEITDIKGKRVLVRADMNVTIGTDGIIDDHEAWRIKRALHTITYLRDQGAKVIVVTHLGRDGASVQPIYRYLQKHITLGFVPQVTGPLVTEMVSAMGDGTILLLENVRQDKREESGDESLAVEFAKLADIYVNDGFAVSHRNHTSVTGIPKLLPSYAGIQFSDELDNLEKMLDPQHPLLVVLGGLKFDTKLPLIEKFLNIADYVFVGGALAHPILVGRGHKVGKSAIDENADVSNLINRDDIIIPEDYVLSNGHVHTDTIVDDHEKIVDIGPESLKLLETLVRESATVFWNGPLGKSDNFEGGTEKFADIVARHDAFSVVGGGDTISVLSKKGIEGRFGFVSTAGGAMLEFLVHGTLPGVDALK